MPAEDLAIDLLAAFRITRLLTEDTFPPIRRARDWLWRRFPPVGHYLDEHDHWQLSGQDRAFRWWKLLGVDICTEVTVTAQGTRAVVLDAHPIGELIGCPWCTGAWIAIGVTVARVYAPKWWDPIARAAAASAATGIIASHT